MDKNKQLKIAVAGLGYVGLSIATLLAQQHKVYAVDIVPAKGGYGKSAASPPFRMTILRSILAEKDLDSNRNA